MTAPNTTARARPRALGAILTLALALLPACTGASALRIEVEDATFARTDGDADMLTFRLRATNPGDKPLPMREIRYDFTLDGQRIVNARRVAMATVRPYESVLVDLPVPIPSGAAAPGQRNYTLTGSANFIKPGALSELLYDTSVYRPSVAFTDAGTIDLPSR